MKEVFAEIITIGDEILFGQTLDTNAHWISEQVQLIGLRVIFRTTVGDRQNDILNALSIAESRADIVFITGGLGPTSDDITKPALAHYFNSNIEMNAQALEELEAYMSGRGRNLNASTRRQAELPVACNMISNSKGTAPGMWFDHKGKVFVSMPGVPHEMREMMTRSILPQISRQFKLPVIHHKIVRTAGIGESWLAEKIVDWESALPPHIKLAYLPHFGDIRMRLTAIGADLEILKHETAALVDTLEPMIHEYIYGYDDDSLPKVVGDMLRSKKQRLAIAESCTGGYISHAITSIAGCSDYFNGSVIPYQNEQKIAQLGVKMGTLETYGAVSEETVCEMAEGVRQRFDADFGLASSGIAGPGGGTPEKPVGLIWIACSNSKNTIAKRLTLVKDRYVNVRLTTVAALNLLRQRLAEKDWD